MKNNKGFTLVELIGIIIIFALISVLAFTSFTKMMKNTKTNELESYKEQLINSATMYIEMNLDSFPELNEIGGNIIVTAIMLSNEDYVSNDIKAPDECPFDKTSIKILKEEDNTLSYSVICE